MISKPVFPRVHRALSIALTDFKYAGKLGFTARYLGLPFAALMASTAATIANPVLNTNASNAQVEAQLAGPGVIIPTGSLSVIAGQNSQYGIFSNGDAQTGGPAIGITDGVMLVTGDANASSPDTTDALDGSTNETLNELLGPNDAGGISSQLGGSFSDPQLTGIDAGSTNDPMILQLRVTPDKTFMKIMFVFASDEYPEFVGSSFNDSFGFFIKPVGSSTWQNIAVVPGTSTPIAVNTVNDGNPGSFAAQFPATGTVDYTNDNLYRANGDGSTPATGANLQYDGFTIPLVVDAAVTPNQTYDVKLAIADSGDTAWDSAVFVKWIASSDFEEDADLELDLTVNDLTPDAGDTVTFTLDVANTGQDPVSGVEVDFDLPAGFVYSGGTIGANYNPLTGIWTVPGTLAAGGGTQSATVTATVGGSGGAINAYAQVTAMSANDVDSTPGNGTPPTVVEDDESVAALTVTGAPASPDVPFARCQAPDFTGITPDGLEDLAFPTGYWATSYYEGQEGLDGTAFGPTNGSGGLGDKVFRGEAFWGTGENPVVSASNGSVPGNNRWTQNETPTSPNLPHPSYTGATWTSSGNPYFQIDFRRTIDVAGTLRLGGFAEAGVDDTLEVFVNGTRIYLADPTGNPDPKPSGTNQVPVTVAAGDEILVRYINLGFIGGYNFGFDVPGYDCSDTPTTGTSYGTASHIEHFGSTLSLGLLNDDDTTDIASPNAEGDGAEDDGVTLPIMTQGETAKVTVNVTGAGGFLQAWIDWNADGNFSGVYDQIALNAQDGGAGDTDGVADGIITLSVFPPWEGTNNVQTFARFRWSTTQNLDSTTAAPNGEVEDYALTVQPPQAIPAVGQCSVSQASLGGTFDGGTTVAGPLNNNGLTATLTGISTNNQFGSARRILEDVSGTMTFTSSALLSDLELAIWNVQSANLMGNFKVTLGDNTVISNPAFAIAYDIGVHPDFLSDPSVGERLGKTIHSDGNTYVFDPHNNGGTEQAAGRLIFPDLINVPQGIKSFSFDIVDQPGNGPSAFFTFAGCVRGDFSDAPTSGTSYGEASHSIATGVQLGITNTAELTAYDSPNADGDVDDGVTLPATFEPGTSVTLPITVSGSGFLNAWIDWNANGVFDEPTEQIATDVQDTGGTGTINLPVTVPSDAVVGQAFARFRWSSAFNIGFTGAAPDGEVEDYQITINDTSPMLSGVLFIDNGIGGTTAHDGFIGGTEASVAIGTIALLDGGGSPLTSVIVAADGSWQAMLPVGYSGTVQVIATANPGYRIISEDRTSVPGATNISDTDGTYSFNATAGTSYSGLNIGLITEPTLTQNQSSSIQPGQIVDLSHLYTATTTGGVSFALVDPVSNPAGGFTSTVFQDVNCDGQPDQVIPASTAVTVGQQICLVVRTQSGAGISPAASYTYGIEATTLYTGTTESGIARNDDSIGSSGGGNDLVLRKLVSNVSKSTPEATSNSGEIGDILRYRIVMSNPASGPATNVVVYDETPAFTALSDSVPPATTVAAGITCTLSVPAVGANTMGYAGPLQWDCPGNFPPGGEGSLTFDVRISP